MTAPPVAVVTGAAGGIGTAIVRGLLSSGWSVVGVDLADRPDEFAAPGPAHPESPTRLAYLKGDVTDETTTSRAIAAAKQLGAVRGLVTATLAEARGPLAELDRGTISRVLDLQATTAWAWGTAVVEAAPADGASIVHVSSVHAERAGAGMAAYAMAKATLGALCRATALEWGPRGVRCNAVLPGFVPVPRNARRWADPDEAGRLLAHHPLGRFVQPEDVAAAVSFLLGPAAAGITGVALPVDGGMLSVLPDWA